MRTSRLLPAGRADVKGLAGRAWPRRGVHGIEQAARLIPGTRAGGAAVVSLLFLRGTSLAIEEV